MPWVNDLEYDEMRQEEEKLPCGTGVKTIYEKDGRIVRQDYNVIVDEETAKRLGLIATKGGDA